jgi:hypothetical protein
VRASVFLFTARRRSQMLRPGLCPHTADHKAKPHSIAHVHFRGKRRLMLDLDR